VATRLITPAICRAGWDLQTQIREEVSFTKGRIILRGKLVTRGRTNRADCIMCFKPNNPIAIIEAKDPRRAVGDGMQQALEYAETLDIPELKVEVLAADIGRRPGSLSRLYGHAPESRRDDPSPPTPVREMAEAPRTRVEAGTSAE
jgi:hypothetical protein